MSDHIDYYEFLSHHVAGLFRLLEQFPDNVMFHVTGIGTVTKVHQDLTSEFEYSSNPVFMVFEVEETEHHDITTRWIRFDGTKNSYGGSTWYRKHKYVTRRITQEVVYE